MSKHLLAGLVLYLSSLGTLAYLAFADTTPKPKTYFGPSAFALLHPKFPCEKFLQGMKTKGVTTTAILWGTFGNDTSCLYKLFDYWASKPKRNFMLEVHFSNESCRRMGRCKKWEFYRGRNTTQYNNMLEKMGPKTTSAVLSRLAEIYAKIYVPSPPNVEVWLSTGLEDNFTPLAAKRIVAILKESWPGKIVRNAVKGAIHSGADIREYHGLFSTQNSTCIYSNDGVPMSVSGFLNSSKLLPNCTKLFWLPRWQGITHGGFVNPSNRNFKIPSNDIKNLKKLAKELS